MTVEWDPRGMDAIRDPYHAGDAQRKRCPVAVSGDRQWTLFRHADVLRAATDSHAFSNNVSTRLNVPNGMDPPEHTAFRRIIDLYFTPDRIAAFEPLCRKITRDLAEALPREQDVDVVAVFAEPFAVRIQCAFTDWDTEAGDALRLWVQRNHEATRAQDPVAMRSVSESFSNHVTAQVERHRNGETSGSDNVISRLLRERVNGRLLRDEEIVSILRNWTAGEMATIVAAVGILALFLAQNTDIQTQLRRDPSLIPQANDEILRIVGPLATNRRVAKDMVCLNHRQIVAGDKIHLNWIAANRDAEAFDEPTVFRFGRNPQNNLLYGAGIHVCPGAPLARMELQMVVEELLRVSGSIRPAEHSLPEPAAYPSSGFVMLPLRFEMK